MMGICVTKLMRLADSLNTNKRSYVLLYHFCFALFCLLGQFLIISALGHTVYLES